MRRERGFTLLEMLAAIVLMVIFASVLLGAFGQSARSLSQVAASDRLDVAARSVMDELDSQPITIGERHGQWDDVEWTLITTRENAAAMHDPALYRLALQIRDGRRQVDYVTLRARTEGTAP
ncbi:type II secretion system protein [Salinicola aestuarinus]|uniref:type II secretion system protein n=1 Tax=Salinicola aestuarinus TaxID=1949082 RepID=UPI000DA11AD2|nr:type II secretion system protein [Salinicola aestuarinus]